MGTRVLEFRPGEPPIAGGLELLETPAAAEAWRWIDLEGLDPAEERRLLTEGFGISRLAIQDAQRERHPPKLEMFESYGFLLLRALAPGASLEAQDLGIVHLSMFIGESFLLTRRPAEVPPVAEVWQDTLAGNTETARGPAHVAYRICRAIVDQYTPVVLGLEGELGELEDAMFEHPDDAVLEQLTRYNRILKRLRRTLAYQHGMMIQLAQGQTPLLARADAHEFRDIAENMERLASLCQLNQELAVDLMNTYLSLASHRLNRITRVLTITAVIFLPLGLLAGIYGMNFEVMPELAWPHAYFVVLGIMASVVLVLVLIFRRLKWL